MDVFFAAAGTLLGGFLIGLLARLAVPGRDPAPIWFTIVLGLSGTVIGAFIAGAVALVFKLDATDPESAPLIGLVSAASAATLLLLAFKHWVQRHPITGPRVNRLPLRVRGLQRIVRRRPHRYFEDTADAEGEPLTQLAKLVALRDAGKIDPTEYERRKLALTQRL